MVRLAIETRQDHRAVAQTLVDVVGDRFQFEDDETGEGTGVFRAGDQDVRFVLTENNATNFVSDGRVGIGFQFSN